MVTGVHVFLRHLLRCKDLGLGWCPAWRSWLNKTIHVLLSGIFSVKELCTAVSDNNNNHIDSHLTTVGSSILIESTAK